MVGWRILVHYKRNFTDHRGAHLAKEWRAEGRPPLRKIRVGQAYELSGDIAKADLRLLTENLLTDPVTQEAGVCPADRMTVPDGVRLAEIWPKEGVADPVADTVAVGARDLKIEGIERIRSGHVYEFWGRPPVRDVKAFCEGHLMNTLVQKAEIQ